LYIGLKEDELISELGEMNGEGEVKRTREFAGDGLHGESKVGEESLRGGGGEESLRGGGEESLRGGGEESLRGGGEELLRGGGELEIEELKAVGVVGGLLLLLLFCIFLVCIFENNVGIFL